MAIRLTRRALIAAGLSAVLGRPRIAAALGMRPSTADVIVIGAGMSGLTAAQKLTERGYRVIVLEGRDRIGGRIWTDRTMGVPLDLGAAWFHSKADNPLVKVARGLGMELVETKWTDTAMFDRDGSPIPAKESAASHASFKKVMGEVFRRMSLLSDDSSLEEVVLGAIEDLGMEGRKSLTDWQVAYLENDYAEELAKLSYRVAREDADFHGGDFAPVAGYAPLVDAFAKGVDVRLAERVVSVDHTGDPVRVRTVRGELSARAVLVTLPIGVLRASLGIDRVATVAFDPPLPERKVLAAKRLGIGLMNKVIMMFPKRFWPKEFDVVGWTGVKHGQFPMFVNGSKLRKAPLLEALIVGDYARSIESLSDEETVSRAMDALRRMFGSGIPSPDRARVTRWGADPFAVGAYSYASLGAHVTDRRALGQPVGDRVFFGGEATHETLSGTVQGAYLSGLREAEKIHRQLTVR
jgi:polyamine oxidase